MNCFATRAKRSGMDWIGQFRAGEHGAWQTVCRKGEPQHFPDARTAKIAAQAALIAYMNGNYVSARAKAEHEWSAGTIHRAGKRPVEVVKI